ncbi:MAG: hypothetical protein AAGC45_11125 [Bacteroidota bacterium]
MDVIKEILDKGPLGILSFWSKSMVLLLFSAIVSTLLTMLVVLLIYGNEMSIQFGY